MLGISTKALSKITASFMVLTSDGSKSNLGLSLKFEAKGLKVIEYSRKDGRYWEFSEKTIKLIHEYRVSISCCGESDAHLLTGTSRCIPRCSASSTAQVTVSAVTVYGRMVILIVVISHGQS